jgi:hypothetical protein
MVMARNVKAAAWAAFALVAAGCRTTEEVLRDYEINISSGSYAAAVTEVAELAEKEDDTQQLWRLLAGAASYMADDKPGALRHFDAAENVFRANDQTGALSWTGSQALSMLANDRTIPYDGGGLDRIFTCIYRAIDFMCGGNADNARVELNRAAQYQANWLYDRRRDIDRAKKKLDAEAEAYQESKGQASSTSQAGRDGAVRSAMSDSDFAAKVAEECGFNPQTSGNLNAMPASRYMNAYMLHLAGVFRWLNGDSPLNLLKDAAAYSSGNPVAKRDCAEMSAGKHAKNQVWIWVEDGLCPCREEWRIDLPVVFIPGAGNYLLYTAMAFPKLRVRTAAASSWTVLAGGRRTELSRLADVDGLVRTEYDVYMRGAMTREITRTLVRTGVQIALGVAAETARRSGGGNWSYIALKSAQAGVAVWAATTTAADLRSWTALPKSVLVARIDRPADGRVVVSADGKDVELSVPEGNALVFVRKPAPFAAPMVKTAVFK